MPRFLLDEYINPAVAIQLRRRGFDARSVHGTNQLGLPDAEALELAAAQGRAVVTYNNVDFEALAAHWFARSQGHGGIVLVHERTIPQRTVSILVIFLTREP